MSFQKYRNFQPIELPERQWPGKRLEQAPTWCSVDLRDGNQALIHPMHPARKRRMFEYLVKMGFKEIEVGFPAASKDDFDFTRMVIEETLVPDDVSIQMLVQARAHLIDRTFEALQGAKRPIIHMYNSTSTLQRRVVFGKSRSEIIELALDGVKRIRDKADENVRFQYSPESFTGTELDFALEICERVAEVWGPTEENPIILNLPGTVEMATPNVYADQIEWFHRHMSLGKRAVISLHAHNDRGTAVAATELGMMAGAGRVEGTLFGNGERTGNVDLVTVAMNLFSQGIDPELDFSHIRDIVQLSEECTEIKVHPRHPYAGDLVFTAFSGSHQDAIRKGIMAMRKNKDEIWQVPYLPIDPADVGRQYEPVVRINSQSGKGGIAFVLEEYSGLRLPRALQVEFSQKIQSVTDSDGEELTPEQVTKAFMDTYVCHEGVYSLKEYTSGPVEEDAPDRLSKPSRVVASVADPDGNIREIEGTGNGPVSAFVVGFEKAFGMELKVLGYEQHALNEGRFAKAVSYVQLTIDQGMPVYGVGEDANTSTSALLGVVSAINRAMARQK
ncbi:MAG: 2-isopropylmalate synthase [Magnetococcales bacterium]|nr:2-isopropylmalate synthase [Magnetococcales bacterium]